MQIHFGWRRQFSAYRTPTPYFQVDSPTECNQFLEHSAHCSNSKSRRQTYPPANISTQPLLMNVNCALRWPAIKHLTQVSRFYFNVEQKLLIIFPFTRWTQLLQVNQLWNKTINITMRQNVTRQSHLLTEYNKHMPQCNNLIMFTHISPILIFLAASNIFLNYWTPHHKANNKRIHNVTSKKSRKQHSIAMHHQACIGWCLLQDLCFNKACICTSVNWLLMQNEHVYICPM